jgi:hypothetical protein
MDKRAGERIPILGEMAGEVMVYHPMHVTDIGRGGATIETSFPLQLDSLHDLRLTLGAISVVVKGRVTHSRISEVDQDVVRYRTGFEFVDMSPAAAGAIDAFLTRVEDTRAGA